MENNIIKLIETSDGTQYKIQGELPVIECNFTKMWSHDVLTRQAITVPNFLKNAVLADGGSQEKEDPDKSIKNTKNRATKEIFGKEELLRETECVDMKDKLVSMVINAPVTTSGTYILKGQDDYGVDVELILTVTKESVLTGECFDPDAGTSSKLYSQGIQYSVPCVMYTDGPMSCLTAYYTWNCFIENGVVKYYYFDYSNMH